MARKVLSPPSRGRGSKPKGAVLRALAEARRLLHGGADRNLGQLQGPSESIFAVNRFRVAKGSEAAFEEVWLSRDSHLDKVPGFVEFHLLKGPEAEDHTLYASHTVWENRATFEAWTRSDAFRAAHSRAGDNKPLYLDHPQFEGFEVLQKVGRPKTAAA